MEKLITGLHHFQSHIFQSHKELFSRLALGQAPEALFITCSDSRINPNMITDTKPGDLFILRNAGNIIPAYNPLSGGEAGTIEFAVGGLGVKDIIVCGHSLCGAMSGLLNPDQVEHMPLVKAWLQQAEATRRVVRDNYSNLSDVELLSVAIQENVLAQIENLKTHPAVASRLSQGALTIHGWVYKIQTGEIFSYDPKNGQFCPLTDAKIVPEAARPKMNTQVTI
ncbi:MAG: carbonic anhydrase [Cyanobacteria bacterium REEB67]|nr:carbonic anhydrase [Cyanobacteria bacterium REEB67]